MKNQIMNRAGWWLALLLTLSASFLGSCSSPLNVAGAESEKGSITLSVQEASRTLLPDISMNAVGYVVEFTSPGKTPVVVNLTNEGSLSQSLEAGVWTVTVDALNDETPAQIIGRGTATATIVGGETTSISITVLPLTGNGTLKLNASFSGLTLASPNVEILLTKSGQTTTQTYSMTVSGSQASFVKSDLASGYYDMTVRLKDGTVTKAGAYEAVRIVTGAETLGLISFSVSGETGQITIVISVDLNLPHTVSILGAPLEIEEGEIFQLTAQTNAVSPTFQWYLDGTAVSGATESTYTIPNNLVVKTYRVDVVVTQGSQAASNFVLFDVIEGSVDPTLIRLYFKSTSGAPTIWMWESGTGGRALSSLMGYTWDTQPALTPDLDHSNWFYVEIPEAYYPLTKSISMKLNKVDTLYEVTGPVTQTQYYLEGVWSSIFPEGPSLPTVSLTPAGGTFTTVPVLVNVNIGSDSTIVQKQYKIDSGAWVDLAGTSLNVGSGLQDGANVQLSVKASNSTGETIVGPFTYTKGTPVTTQDPRNLRVYQVMVEAYQDGDPNANHSAGFGPSSHRGDIKGITGALQYIQDLGVNALWMTPIFNSFTGAENGQATGYFADNYFAVDPQFGTDQDFKDLVAAAHQKGLYVILDGVFGHHGADVQASPSGKKPKALQTQWYGYQVDYSHPDTVAFYKEVAVYWVQNYGIDGWRLDQAYQVPLWAWKEIREAVEAASLARKNAGETWGTLGYMVGEIWDGNPANIVATGYGTTGSPGLLSNFDFPVRYSLVQVLATQEHSEQASGYNQPATKLNDMMNSIASAYPSFAVPNLMLTNHDLVYFGDLIQRAPHLGYGTGNADYWKRHKLALSFMAAFTGSITLYYGDEYGAEVADFVNEGDRGFYDDHVSRDNGRISGFNANETDLINYTKSIWGIRAAHSALWKGTRSHLLSNATQYADLKTDGTQKVLYLMNVGTSSSTFTINGVGGSSLKDLQSNEVIGGSGSYSVNVPALSARFLIVQ